MPQTIQELSDQLDALERNIGDPRTEAKVAIIQAKVALATAAPRDAALLSIAASLASIAKSLTDLVSLNSIAESLSDLAAQNGNTLEVHITNQRDSIPIDIMSNHST